MLENLYGRIPDETKIVAEALRSASTRRSAHTDDRGGWSDGVPSYGHCDLYTDYVRQIWGRNEKGHWNTEARIMVQWAYKNEELYLAGPKKNKLTVHYSFLHPEYGHIDLSRDQFPDKTYLHARLRPLPDMIPVGKSWHPSSEMTKRKELFEKVFVESLLESKMPTEISPELSNFLKRLSYQL